MAVAQELTIDTIDEGAVDAEDLANEIFGLGVTVESATYTGDGRSAGIYSGADTTTPGVAPADSGVILSTGLAEDFTNSDGSTNTNTATNTSTNTTGTGDADFTALAGIGTADAAFLEIDFVPTGNLLTIDFIISSEEYPEFVGSNFNDVVGVWVNDQPATVSIGDGTTSINNINDDLDNVYVDNANDEFNTEMDGFTITLSFVAPVNVGETNTIKIGIADVGDSNYDSNLLIAGGSAQTAIVAQDDQAEFPTDKTRTLDVLGNDNSSAGGSLTITHINENAVSAGDTVILASGQEITLNADGTFTVVTDGDDETVYFNYTVEDSLGNTDDALVTIVQTPCFMRGTRILTANGECEVQDLQPGTLVRTMDQGLQPIRWIGSRRTKALPHLRPIRIQSGALGTTRDLYLSPQHRVLVSSSMAELMFGEPEVLVKAKDLVNDTTVRPSTEFDEVEYFHLLFDTHQIIWSNGIPTESYYPGPQSLKSFDNDVQTELQRLFPELCPETGAGFGDPARPALKPREARLLRVH